MSISNKSRSEMDEASNVSELCGMSANGAAHTQAFGLG